MKIKFSILLILSITNIDAQKPFQGIVMEQNSNKTPIANAQIKSEFSNSITSDSKGVFSLKFQNRTLGDEIYLQAEKTGYEIVNFKEMSTKIPKKQTKPFKIIMCKSGLVAQNRMKYYEISEKHITQKYERELAKLNRSIEDWREKAEKLEENFRGSLEFARELADRYSMMNLDDVSELQRRAFRLYKENKVDQALKILEGENYQDNIKQVKTEQKKIQDNTHLADNEIAKAEEIIQQQISKLMFQADLYAQDFQFDKAERTYEIAVEADTSNFDNIFKFAYFSFSQNKLKIAHISYLRALNNSKNLNDKLKCLTNLSICKKDMGLIHESISIMNGIIKNLKPDDIRHVENLFMICVNLGVCYLMLHDFSNAELYFEKAIIIFNNYPNKLMPEYFYNNLSLLYINLGLVNHESQNINKAVINYSKSIELLKSNTSQFHLFHLAMAYMNLGMAQMDLKNYSDALLNLNNGLRILSSFEKNNPNKYREKLGVLNYNLGLIHYELKDYTKSMVHSNKAIELLERLNLEDNLYFKNSLGLLYRQIGRIYFMEKDYNLSRIFFNKSIKIFNSLFETSPDQFGKEYFTTCYFLGLLQYTDFKESENFIIKENLKKIKNILKDQSISLDDKFRKNLLNDILELLKYL